MTRIYLKPAAFVDSPAGLDGRVDRLAGGGLWFSAYDVIRVESGRRVAQDLIPVARIEAMIAALPAAQADAAATMRSRIVAPRSALEIGGGHQLQFDVPMVMAILNMTPDSFSDGGRHVADPAAAADAALRMVADGAAIIDVGGESTRPGAATIAEDEEIARVVPVVERLADAGVIVSIDTRKAAVMAAALHAGAGLVNDVAALLYDSRAAEVVADAGCPVVLMHYPGTPHDPHGNARYRDPLIEVYDWLEARIDAVVARGVSRDRIIVDPGIGFGKPLAANLALVNGLPLFQALGCPVLLGASRKRVIGALANDALADRRLGGSIGMAFRGADLGAQIVRVHDAAETAQALMIWRGLRDAALAAAGR